MPLIPSKTFCPENIPEVVSTFRTDGAIPVLDQKFHDGGQCRIYKVNFLDGKSWSVRFPIHVRSESQEDIVKLLKDEQDVLQELDEKGFPWAAKHIGSCFTFDNSIGFPYIALSWIEGMPLSWTTTYPPRLIRNKILDQVATIQITLIECTKEDRSSAAQYFSRLTDNKVQRILTGKLPGITEEDCSDQKRHLSRVLQPELENAPFAIDHGDLSPSNILVDSDYNVTGIIDWGFASKVPIHLAGRLPRFLQLSELILPPPLLLQEDRKVYRASLMSNPSQAASWMLHIQSPEDVDFRHWFLESTISKGMHRSLVSLGWKIPYREL
ncbi:hypothetical protein PMIN03_011819 [Paraphaeosphaeria minitans]|uniref:Aminoglycoside phosphotransferase domain-containing protein n=1 Tax=Paraphaeosphaeria minitans TaxID=565426 RepID=A0A9P6GDQ9_9PLEO|nr:hypothetical protein PMIN01_08205 [Paraphaeosphaeria minitans]